MKKAGKAVVLMTALAVTGALLGGLCGRHGGQQDGSGADRSGKDGSR